MRDSLLRTLTAFGGAAAILTELLSLFHLLRPIPLAIAWTLIIAAALLTRARRPSLPKKPCALLLFLYTAIAAIVATIALTAILSPPNSADAMAYHLPRVIYWAQAHSVAFFPTPYFNQVMLQPFNEYLMLHTYLLTGTDRLINLITCAAFAACIVGVSAIARELHLDARAQAFAALFCATLPNAILQASGAKNEVMLALWMVCAVYFAARRQVIYLALAVALAFATKATAYLFLPPLLLALGIRRPRHLLTIVAAVLFINGPQYLRNLQLSGSPLGYDSAQADGVYRWRNEHPGLRPLLSNLIRHTSEQLGARSPQWNQAVYAAALHLHQPLHLNPQDPDTTWRYARFDPPVNANHEANANNRWHLLVIATAALLALLRGPREWRLYAAGLITAFLLFCLYLKWQPFLARLELPLFVLSSVLVAWLTARLRFPSILVCALSLFLLSNARLALFENWTRPLKGPNNLFHSNRDRDYFRDMAQWPDHQRYFDAADRVALDGCDRVGIDISEFQLEYPFQALLRERRPNVRFVHTGVAPVPPLPADTCAVLCMDCVGKDKKLALYRDFQSKMEIGTFLLYESNPK